MLMHVAKDRTRHLCSGNLFYALLPFVLLVPLSLCRAQASSIDPVLQEIYEHFMGKSLSQAIMELPVADQVKLQSNGGNCNNHLCIGKKNSVEILVRNNSRLKAMTLGFALACRTGSFSVVGDYVVHPYRHSPSRVVKLEKDPEGDPSWDVTVDDSKLPDSILISASARDSIDFLPVNRKWRRIYSLQVFIPDSTTPMDSGFTIDNICYPPGDGWAFVTPDDSSYAPYFQGNTNTGPTNPDAPPVYFNIKGDTCSVKAPKPLSLARAPKEWPKVVKDYNHAPGVIVYNNGEVWLSVMVVYTCDAPNFQIPGVVVDWVNYGEDRKGLNLPIELLPRVCNLEGIKRIYVPYCALELNGTGASE